MTDVTDHPTTNGHATNAPDTTATPAEEKPKRVRTPRPALPAGAPADGTPGRTVPVHITAEAATALANLRTIMAMPGYNATTESDIISPAITAAFEATVRRLNGGRA